LDTGLPKEWQLAVLRRFTVLAPPVGAETQDARQLELF